MLRRRGLLTPEGELAAGDSQVQTPLERLYQAAARDFVSSGTIDENGQPVLRRRPRSAPEHLGPRLVDLDGVNVHADLRIEAGDPAARECPVRYLLRPPFAEDQISETADGLIALALRKRRKNGEPSCVASLGSSPGQACASFFTKASWRRPPAGEPSSSRATAAVTPPTLLPMTPDHPRLPPVRFGLLRLLAVALETGLRGGRSRLPGPRVRRNNARPRLHLRPFRRTPHPRPPRPSHRATEVRAHTRSSRLILRLKVMPHPAILGDGGIHPESTSSPAHLLRPHLTRPGAPWHRPSFLPIPRTTRLY